jgi:hypothetical protein
VSQVVFIDDAGDPGFKFEHGSSEHFVITCLIFDDNLVAEEVSLYMKKLKRSLGWSDGCEFKFNKTNKETIRSLLASIANFDFRIRVICVHKPSIYSRQLRSNQDSFYNYMIRLVLQMTPNLRHASVKLDGRSGREYKKGATTYFRKQLNTNDIKVSKFKFVDSRSDNLIQLADLVAGAVLRSTRKDKTDCSVYLKCIEKRIEDIWYFH